MTDDIVRESEWRPIREWEAARDASQERSDARRNKSNNVEVVYLLLIIVCLLIGLAAISAIL
jgi:hypothetical protein